MLTLVINSKKCLTSNLSKDLNFVNTFFLKSYSTFMSPNFIGKFVQTNCTFIAQS